MRWDGVMCWWCAQVSYHSWCCLLWCGSCNCIQPPGTVGTRAVITALKAARCVQHSWEWCWEERELVLGRSRGQRAKYPCHTFTGHIPPASSGSAGAVTSAPCWAHGPAVAVMWQQHQFAKEGSKPSCLALSCVEGFDEDPERG